MRVRHLPVLVCYTSILYGALGLDVVYYQGFMWGWQINYVRDSGALVCSARADLQVPTYIPDVGEVEQTVTPAQLNFRVWQDCTITQAQQLSNLVVVEITCLEKTCITKNASRAPLQETAISQQRSRTFLLHTIADRPIA